MKLLDEDRRLIYEYICNCITFIVPIEPSTSVQEASGSSSPRKRKAEEDTVGPSKKPQNLDASKKKNKKRRTRRRRVANMQVNMDNKPEEDHPVLAQRSSSISKKKMQLDFGPDS